uniref:Uncharacterized protein n=1 Tax=Ascaris lumbricoides TaxID=6252 RepID=A0A0M3IVJ5_ASCLU
MFMSLRNYFLVLNDSKFHTSTTHRWSGVRPMSRVLVICENWTVADECETKSIKRLKSNFKE